MEMEDIYVLKKQKIKTKFGNKLRSILFQRLHIT